MVSQFTSIDVKISQLENLKRQAMQSVSYVPYGSELILPGVRKQWIEQIYDDLSREDMN